jgi:CheY-like chemotaxis protein
MGGIIGAALMVSDTIAHDINNLLMIVAGCCERLTRQAALTPAQVAELERIALATNQAASLTSQLIATNRGTDVGPSATDLAEALRRGVHLLEHSLGDGVRIEMRLGARNAWVPMSDGQISQVLINLALNARDAMPDGGVFTISTGVLALDATAAATHRLPAGEYVDLEVRDNGSGMDAETRAHAFERFFTTKAAGRGTGLGLPSVKRVVEWCGGTIDLRSVPGHGTRFTILLPLVDEPPPHDLPADDQSMLRAHAGETVMVAEDEPVVREIVASLLRGLGYDTLEAASAEEALAALSAHRIDVLVSDIDLPDLNGVELAGRLAAKSPATKVLFMSGYGDEGSLPSGIPHGSAFMQKPFTGPALAQKVRDMLDATPSASPAGPR